MTFVVGLTGGFSSGKSLSAQFFAECGAPIIDADQIARALVAKQQPALKKIVQRFGPEILQKNGELDRSMLRELIFNHPEQKRWLEGLLHPSIHQIILQKISEVDFPYCVVVIPLLAEHFDRYRDIINHVIVIDVSEEQQIIWAAKRDGCAKNLIKKVIAAQSPRDERLKIANTVLLNNSSSIELKNKIRDLHQLFSLS